MMQTFFSNFSDSPQSQNYQKYSSILQSYWQLTQDFNRLNEQNQKIENQILEVSRKTAQLHQFLKKSTEQQKVIPQSADIKNLVDKTNKEPIDEKLQNQISESVNFYRKRVRKPSQKRLKCPYKDCHRLYDSSVSLNLHMKLKHNAGTKKQRETLADLILQALEKGKEPPVAEISLPPEYLENYRMKKLFKLKYSM